MTISWIWAGMVTAALLCGLFFGTLDAVAAAALSGAQSAVELSLSMAGILCLWSGVMEVLRACGLADKIAALFRAPAAAAFAKCQPGYGDPRRRFRQCLR